MTAFDIQGAGYEQNLPQQTGPNISDMVSLEMRRYLPNGMKNKLGQLIRNIMGLINV